MRKIVIFVALLFWLSGCSILGMNDPPLLYRLDQSSKLSSARDMLRKGKEDTAIKVLTEICTGKGVAGVTDEALFRLALIYLGHDQEIDTISRAQRMLERLRREYPASLWAVQSSGLLEFITKARPALENSRELRRQIKDLQDVNLSLARENKKLRLNIEQLKTLDMELEQKPRP